MKKLAFLFLAIVLSFSATWAAPASNIASDAVAVVVTADEAAPKACTITIKGTIGKEPIDISVTVEADNCAVAAADFLKQMAKK